jgi:hypothetical protein
MPPVGFGQAASRAVAPRSFFVSLPIARLERFSRGEIKLTDNGKNC